MSLVRSITSTLKSQVKAFAGPLIQRYRLPPARLTPAQWSLRDSPDGLRLQDVPLNALLREFGSPLHVVDAGALRQNARRFQHPHGRPGGCEIYYSYKTNPIPGVIRLLHNEGIGAEVISHYELWLALQLDMPPDRIVYNGPAKSTESLRQAVDLGLQIINLNHAEEIQRIVPIARELGKRPRVGLRVTTGDGWTGQFGTPIAGGAALAAYREALASDVLDVVGVHAHLGGMIHSRDTVIRAVSGVLDFVEQMETACGISLEILNFGGSLATPTVHHIAPLDLRLNQTFRRDLPEPDPDASLSIDDHVTTVMQCVRERYLQQKRPVPRVFLEPGRSMTGNTQMLAATVMTTKQVPPDHFLILDAGINLAESVRNEYHHMFPVRGSSEAKTEAYTVAGPICSPGDTLYYTWRSRKLVEGDSVVIMDAGAYFVPFSTSFAFPRPAIVMLDDGNPSLLRRAERFEDIVGYDLGG